MPRFDVADAPALIRAAREDSGFTQSELARRAGITQPNLASIENGARAVSGELLERILRAADYRPSLALVRYADEIRAAAEWLGLSEIRVFGSALRGEDHFDSDIDLFVSSGDEVGLFTLAALASEVEALTGFPADVISETSALHSELGRRLVPDAVPL